MFRAIKYALVWGAVLLAATVCCAQSADPGDADRTAAINAMADQFMQRLHQKLDVSALADMFVADMGARYRESPGDFLPFAVPRMAKTLLNTTDEPTLRHKLFADWNLAYLSSILVKSSSNKTDLSKTYPSDFLKLTKKSECLKALTGQGPQVTLIDSSELKQYLAEADDAIPMLRKAVKPEMIAAVFQTIAQPASVPAAAPYTMGYDTTYSVRRESLLLVFVYQPTGPKLVTLAAPDSN